MSNFQGAKEQGIALLNSTATCNLNATAGTELGLYTVPVGKTAIIHSVVMRTFSADTLLAVVTFGHTGTCEEWSGDVTLTGVTASYAEQVLILQPVPATTPLAKSMFTAGEVFMMEITTAAGSACTCTIDVFGYLF